MDRNLLTPNEIKTLSITVSKLISYAKLVDVDFADVRFIRDRINYIFDNDLCRRSIRGVNPIFRKLNTALLLCAKVSPDKNMAFAIILSELTEEGGVTIEEVTKRFGDDVSSLVRGLLKVSSIYKKRWAIQQHGTPEIAISEKEKEK
ncbi:MAG: HD domain-containing protein, partial [Muribaculaceae bacterium]|nr:HD domain-containing protein [Muribaculaceae bacterium]